MTPADCRPAPPPATRPPIAALDRHADRLARGLAVVINLLDPDVIVLGGGLSNMDHLYTELPRRIPAMRSAMSSRRRSCATSTATRPACAAPPGSGQPDMPVLVPRLLSGRGHDCPARTLPPLPELRRRPAGAHRSLLRLTIAHIDCDAFYASVEKRDRPELQSRPVIVGGGTRGVVTAACYVARIYGVKSAMPMFKALQACPDAVVIKPDFAKYTAASRQVRTLDERIDAPGAAAVDR